ncbi:MAG: FtsX-like permease family protein [Prolixibacteraceae bacterium]|jgi:putative ABC transport system permease protein|nr:FtsX-like permease family protein [Prolixibacteraceae bacterium]MBT6766950.1 FtsX-like permease family protein [Prolixibacteraceae bacterium]MBT6997982.1 FtsX-like permease family protein [Prolixibacteraceae bacterium]MBT7396008.1 FtsX-like permease family protein [Prolixibacteraceae bacterium]
MIKLFLKTAIYRLRKDKFHSFLNIGGLALGLVAFLYIATYTFHEISYDSFHSKADRIYRCVAHIKLGERALDIPRSETPLAAAAKNDFPEIEEAIRLYPLTEIITRYKEKKFVESEICYADVELFDVFDFKLLEGNPKTALGEPNSIVLGKEVALKYFGDENPMGKSILLTTNKVPYVVTGILDEIPKNSSLQSNLYASFCTLPESKRLDNWGAFNNVYTYIVTKKGINIEEFEAKFDASIRKYEDAMIQREMGISLSEFESQGNFFIHKLQPLKDIHLNSTYSENLSTYGNKRFLIIFGITGLLILIIAGFNFVNLTTSRASLRAKEIGIKKIIGSTRKSVILQILIEIFLHILIALVISIVILLLILPFLNNFSEIVIQPEFLLNPLTSLTIIFIPLIITILAGIYPAFLITAFKPVDVIKRKFKEGNSKSLTRGGLVTIQFVVFIGLVFCTLIIRRQINYMHQQNPGFEKENVLVVENMGYLDNNRNSFKMEMLKNPSVLSASYSSLVPSVDDNAGNIFCEKGSDKTHSLNRMDVDSDFQKTLKVQLKAGSFFTDNEATEKYNAIINEEAARLLGWSDCNEKYIYDYNYGKDFKVIGIMKDFHMKSLRDKSKPLVIKYRNTSRFLSLNVQSNNLPELIKSVESQWGNFNEEAPFEYFFLDQSFNAQYKSEERLAKVIGVFTIFAIMISCIGLLGLVSYAATQKKKEIGIRKVNGAKVSEILGMLNRDFVKWVGIAFIIAVPVSYFAMNKWLEGFAYKTTLSWWIFALSGVIALGIALLTVSWQSWRAATRNPVEALRYE